jgi:hypothetical protein
VAVYEVLVPPGGAARLDDPAPALPIHKPYCVAAPAVHWKVTVGEPRVDRNEGLTNSMTDMGWEEVHLPISCQLVPSPELARFHGERPNRGFSGELKGRTPGPRRGRIGCTACHRSTGKNTGRARSGLVPLHSGAVTANKVNAQELHRTVYRTEERQSLVCLDGFRMDQGSNCAARTASLKTKYATIELQIGHS